jgi:uncharacterized protein YbjT (DUF2867 family)
VILLAGGSGRRGSVLVRRLAARGQRVRVLTRDPARAATLVGPQVEAVPGDVRDPDALTAALAGIATVVSAVHGFAGPGRVTPAAVDRDGNRHLVAAAGAAGADMVLVSVVGAAPDHPMELFRMKALAEDALRGSGVAWTVVRSTAFAELYLELMDRSAGRSGRPLVFGRGNNPVNFVSVEDVAAVVELAVTDRCLRGQVLEVGGPQNLTLNELAALTQHGLGATHRPRRRLPGRASGRRR